MASVFDKLVGKQLITEYPGFMKNNVHYEAMVGSVAYGVSQDSSDIDIYGFCMPPKHILFPYQSGAILGFGRQPEAFNQFQKHHIKEVGAEKEYDISIFNIVRFFQLCMESNPNMVDSLFVPQRCVLHCSELGQYVRENRKLFLSKLAWHKFKGYAYSQQTKMNDKAAKEFVDLCTANDWPLDITYDQARKETDDEYVKNIFRRIDQSGIRTKRLKGIQTYGYDVKFATHLVRLLEEVQQILEEGDLDITRNSELLKTIRSGAWSQQQVNEYFDNKMKVLESVYEKSTLPHKPREAEIKNLLIECIQYHYGPDAIEKTVNLSGSAVQNIWRLKDIVDNMVRDLK